MNQDWREFVRENRDSDLKRLIQKDRLDEEKTRAFLENAFSCGIMSDMGRGLPDLMPKRSFFAKKNALGEDRSELKNRIFAVLKEFFDKYFGICGFEEDDEKTGKNVYPFVSSENAPVSMAAEKNQNPYHPE